MIQDLSLSEDSQKLRHLLMSVLRLQPDLYKNFENVHRKHTEQHVSSCRHCDSIISTSSGQVNRANNDQVNHA